MRRATVSGRECDSPLRASCTVAMVTARSPRQARCSTACRMLDDMDRKVIEVSLALGYTDSANFTRACRRWTGTSPQELRQTSELLALRD
jgi:AraC-like DNA-binding protein